MTEITEELGRVDLAKHKHAFVVVGYDADRDICIGVGESQRAGGYDPGPPTVAPMSPQATMKVRALLATALKQRGDD